MYISFALGLIGNATVIRKTHSVILALSFKGKVHNIGCSLTVIILQGIVPAEYKVEVGVGIPYDVYDDLHGRLRLGLQYVQQTLRLPLCVSCCSDLCQERDNGYCSLTYPLRKCSSSYSKRTHFRAVPKVFAQYIFSHISRRA